MASSLFAQILGASFAALPFEVRRVHDERPVKVLHGQCSIVRGTHWLVAPIAWIASLPDSEEDAPVTVSIRRDQRFEYWSRDFSGHKMNSKLRREGSLLIEWLGFLRFTFALRVVNNGIAWEVKRVAVFGLPLPSTWFSDVHARESCDQGRYIFDVRTALPLVGPLIQYRGWLEARDKATLE